MISTEAIFLKAIFDIPKNDRSDLFTRDDVEEKIKLLSGAPPSKKDPLIYNKWYRINKRYTIVRFQTSKLLYLRGLAGSPSPITGEFCLWRICTTP